MQKTVENFLTGYPGNGDNIFMNSSFWWIKQAVVAALWLLFLVLGIETLIASYRLDNPLNFIMAFFSASLIILVSIVGILYPVAQVYSLFKPKK
jgi:di/tricarboxylate transporter